MNKVTNEAPNQSKASISSVVPRSVFGGVLMGLANLVPGISGGTMLLAAGIYPQFINAIADTTKFKFKLISMLVLGTVVLSAGLAILIGAGTLKDLVVNHRWIMYSLFIGLTLGGVPLVWKMARPVNSTVVATALISFAMMAGLAILKAMNITGDANENTVMYAVAGIAGASAMILPGLSGGYILLLMGQYVPILSAIDQFKDAIKAKDFAAAMDPAITVLLPVGIGVIVGVVVVGNLVQWLLNKYQKATLGILLGLLIGSTIGLWPFQQCTQPAIGDTVKGQVVTETNIDEIDHEDWPTHFFAPNVLQIGGAIGLIVLGFLLTVGVSRIGAVESNDESNFGKNNQRQRKPDDGDF